MAVFTGMRKNAAKGNSVAPWRFLVFFAVLAAGAWIAVPMWGWSKGTLVAFDIAALVFIASCIRIFGYDAQRMRRTAEKNDANRVILLGISFILSALIFGAVVAELAQRATMSSGDKMLVAASLALVWIFANAVYTLHYAHLFYTSDDKGKDCAGLNFPGTNEPLFADFVYFSFTLGVAVQTSDVAVTSRHIRNVVTAHCVAGWFFNLGVLALTINVLGSG